MISFGSSLRGCLFCAVCVVLLMPAALEARSDEASHRAAVVSMFEQGWNLGETDVFGSTIAKSVDFHYAGSHRVVSRQEMSAIVLRWREAFPDLQITIDEILAEEDIVAARMTWSGTHQGSWRGVEPTGKTATMAMMMFFRFENGLLVELWEVDDQLGLRKQLGLVPE